MLQRRQARQRREQSLGNHDGAIAAAEPTSDLAHLLDDEIDRLPERLRRVVVICYLEGRGTEEAATMIGCPRGTVLSRLATARETLRRRLERRGIAPAVLAGLATAAAQMVTADLTAAALRCALASRLAEVSPRILSLSNGAIQTMLWKKCRLATAFVLFLATCLLGAGFGLAQKPQLQPKAEAPPKAKPEATPADSDAAKIRSLLNERRDNLRNTHDITLKRLPITQNLSATIDRLLSVQESILNVELELSQTPKERLEAYERSLKSAQGLFKMIETRVKDQIEPPQNLYRTRDNVRIEIAMLKEKMKQKSK